MPLFLKATILGISFGGLSSLADEALYQYEGDVVPYDESAGWIIADPCDPPCSEDLQDGHFILRWPIPNNFANYAFIIAQPPEKPPETLWVEWRFRSNHPLGLNFFTCDGAFSIKYGGMLEVVWMYGDAAISFSGGGFVLGLELDAFHTYRFESLDGVNYWISVDGHVFIVDADDNPNGLHRLQFSGDGGCASDWIPDMVNEWDMVRYGTIAYGEQIIATDPPGGFLDPNVYPAMDRFAVTFDSPNYVYIDEITVEVSGGDTPVVTQSWRRDGDGPETLEIVLDAPIPLGQHTRFILDDGVAVNIVDYSYILGDADGDGDLDLDDFAAFADCVTTGGPNTPAPASCAFADMDADTDVDLADFQLFQLAFTGG